jgi:hypothetical protein
MCDCNVTLKEYLSVIGREYIPMKPMPFGVLIVGHCPGTEKTGFSRTGCKS